MLVRIGFICFLFVLPLGGFSQYNSLFTRGGLGEQVTNQSARYQAIGGASVGIYDSLNVNFSNPASYASYSITNFQSGLNYAASDQFIQDAHYKDHNSWLSNLSFGIPILAEKAGMSFGTMSVFSKSYDYTTTVVDSLAGVDESNRLRASGEVNKAYVGFAWSFVNTRKLNVALGVNFNSFFGGFSESNVLYMNEPSSPLLDVRRETEQFLFGRGYDLGINLNYSNFKDGMRNFFTFGGVYNSDAYLKGEQTIVEQVGSYNVGQEGFVVGTIPYEVLNQTGIGVAELPGSLKLGFSFGSQPKGASEELNTNIYHFEFSQFNTENIQVNGVLTPLSAYRSYRAGYEFQKHYTRSKEAIIYRFGAFLQQSASEGAVPAQRHFGLTFGSGIPLYKSKSTLRRSFSKLNLSITGGYRTLGAADELQEMYVNASLALTISNRWFYRQKIQ